MYYTEDINELNDNELLYFISEHDECALGILFNKYLPLIAKRIKSFNIRPYYIEDFSQEGKIILFRAIKLYEPLSNKTFNKFFDLLLQRRFMTLLKKNKDYFTRVKLVEDISYLEDELYEDKESYNISDNIEESKLKNLSGFEKIVMEDYINGYKPKDISMRHNVPIKKIYNTICRIKIKLK